MDAIEKERLPNILQAFRTNKEKPPSNAAYHAQISHYLSIFSSKNPQTIAAIMYEALIELFGRIWEELYSDAKSKGELKKIDVIWWEAHGDHHPVDAEFYLENWKENYAGLAENWGQVIALDSIDRVSNRIIKGIAGLLYVREYEDTIFATLKYHQQTYPRLNKRSLFGRPHQEYRDKYGWLVKEVVECAAALSYSEGINFIGELSGAYILSCPAKYTKPDSSFQEISPRNTAYSAEEKCTMVLLKYICEYGSQEFAMTASEFPLRYIKKPGEDWKYVVEIPQSL